MIQVSIGYILYFVLQFVILYRGIWNILILSRQINGYTVTPLLILSLTNPYIYRYCTFFFVAAIILLLLPWILMFISPTRKRMNRLQRTLKAYRICRSYLLLSSSLWCGIAYLIFYLGVALYLPFLSPILKSLLFDFYIMGIMTTIVYLVMVSIFLYHVHKNHPAIKRYNINEYQHTALLYGNDAERLSTCSDLIELANLSKTMNLRLFDAQKELAALAQLWVCPVQEVLDRIRIHVYLLDTKTPEETEHASKTQLEELKEAGQYRLDVQVLFILQNEAALPVRTNQLTDCTYHVLRRPTAKELRLLCEKQCHWTINLDAPAEFRDTSELVRSFPELDLFYRELSKASPFLFEFLHYGMLVTSQQQSVMALLDYIDLLLRIMSYTVYFQHADLQTKQQILELDLIKSTYIDLAKIILRYTPKDDSDVLFIRFRIDHLMCFNKLQEIFELRFEDTYINFLGIVSLLQYVRNKTRGHGILQVENIPHVWSFVAYSALWLSYMLRITDLSIQIEDSKVMCGYKNDKQVSLDKFAFARNGHPCLAFQVFKEQIEYIDYYEGEFIRPELLSNGLIVT